MKNIGGSKLGVLGLTSGDLGSVAIFNKNNINTANFWFEMSLISYFTQWIQLKTYSVLEMAVGSDRVRVVL